jgi:hypothetical protein
MDAHLKRGRCRPLAEAWSDVGDVHYLSGEFALAESSYQRALALGAVPRQDPGVEVSSAQAT